MIGGVGPTKTISLATPMPPENVTTEHCYSTGSEYVFLSLISATELHVAYGVGSCPPVFPMATSKTYLR